MAVFTENLSIRKDAKISSFHFSKYSDTALPNFSELV